MKALTIALIAVAASIGVCAVAMSDKQPMLQTKGTGGYTCASVHFGMDDTTKIGDVNLANSDIVAVGEHDGSIGVVSGITMTSHEVVNQAINAHTNQGLKFSSSKKNSTVILTFDQNIVGCALYAVGWSSDSCSVKVNDGTKTTIDSDASIVGSTLIEDVEYVPYSFTFDATDTLTIAATKRIVIGDIALRVAS